VTGVEPGRHAFGVDDVDVVRQGVIQPGHQRRGRQCRGEVDVYDLRERVNARIGSS
jgi:hypothetical protein